MLTMSGRNLFELLQAKRRLAKYYYKPSGSRSVTHIKQIMCAVYSSMNSKHFNFTIVLLFFIVVCVLLANIEISRITSIVKLVKHRNCFICKSDICCSDTERDGPDTHATSSTHHLGGAAVEFPLSMRDHCGQYAAPGHCLSSAGSALCSHGYILWFSYSQMCFMILYNAV